MAQPYPDQVTSPWQRFFQLLAILELPTAVLGIWVGGNDVISAPWLHARILGLMIFLLGVLVAASLVIDVWYFAKLTDSHRRLILAGSVSGAVIDTVFMLDAIHYELLGLILCALAAVPCVLVAGYFYDWSLVQGYVKTVTTAGILSALIPVGTFLYSSVYLPSTADVPIEATLDSASVSSAGSGLDLLDVKIDLQDKSAVKAVTLTSMVAVYGVTYNGQKDNFAASPSQGQATAVGENGTIEPNLEFNGTRNDTLVTVRRAVSDGAFLPANVTLTTSIPVLVPARKYSELDVILTIQYARADRLTLVKKYFGPRAEDMTNCPNDIRSAWYIAQSQLGRLTRGRETAVTDWCATVSDPQITSYIGGAPGKDTPGNVVRLLEQAYQTRVMRRFWVIQISGN